MAETRSESADPLLDLAGSVADRSPVDWEGEQSRTPEKLAALARLRELAVLQAAHAQVRDAVPSGSLFSWGPLQAFERIGEGSFAEVYRAWDTTLQREVALKLRRAELDVPGFASRRWIEEARRLARVRHPHVVSVLGADEQDGRAGIWTELVDGNTLEQWITLHGPLGPREAAGVGIDLCGALAAVHAADLVHGDVTTRNVMREGRAGAADHSGRIVLMDFGSAQDSRVADVVAFGTPMFMAPEVLAGAASDVRSDVYSVGVVLYRLLTARYPIEPGSLDAMRSRLERGERTPLRSARPDLPHGLVDAVERACDPERLRRHADMAALERELSQSFPSTERVDPASRPARRMPGWLGLAAAGIAVALAATVLLVRDPWHVRGVPAATPTSDPVQVTPQVQSPNTEANASTSQPAPLVAPELEATLFRVTAGSREALRTGDLVAPGDELALEVTSREPVHVYVLTEDEAGAVFVLFPLSGRGTHNPLAAGVRHRLPGREQTEELSWQVTSAGGRETFLVLASRAPLAPVAEAVATIPQAAADAAVAYRTLPADALARLRGVGGVVRGPTLQEASHPRILSGLAHDLAKSRTGREVWMRLLVLENPAR